MYIANLSIKPLLRCYTFIEHIVIVQTILIAIIKIDTSRPELVGSAAILLGRK